MDYRKITMHVSPSYIYVHFLQLISKLSHIYQYQRHENVLLKGAILQSALYLSFGKYNPYRYTLIQGKAYFDYNIEQQGDIAKDIYLNRIENIILDKNAVNHSI